MDLNRTSSSVFYATVSIGDDGKLQVRSGKPSDHDVAWGVFEDTLNETGWGKLDIATNPAHTNDHQAYGAGLVEGFLTAQHIFTTYHNLLPHVYKNGEPPAVSAFVEKQDSWVRTNIATQSDTSAEWRQIGYIMQQFDGLVAGYGQSSASPLELKAFRMLNNVGDLFDIVPAVVPEERVDWHSLTRLEAEQLHADRGHCSGLVKVTGNFSDLFMGHSSWFVFSNTNRIFKTYNLSFNDDAVAAKIVAFSSYPGFLESLDDFYLMSSGLGMVQTTNGILDSSVYDGVVVPESLYAWQRVRLASALAHSAPEWGQLIFFHSCGTYANQYMVVDFNLFTPGQPLKPNTFWVAEDMPGHYVSADQTETLKRGYWPSYNVPYYPEVYQASGYEKMAELGNYFTYQLAPRAQIFRRDQGTVVDLTTFGEILRSNKYLTDPYSLDDGVPNPMYAICSRGDLSKVPRASGCYDTKITSYLFGATKLRALALNGPTTSGGTLAPFSWDGVLANDTHSGLPATYNFGFVEMLPRDLF